jgi:hypothetical protein
METNDNYSPMIHLLLTTIAAVVLVGCGEPRQSSPPETQPAEPVAEAAKPEPPTAKVEAPDIPIHEAAELKSIKGGDPAVQALEVMHQKDLPESKGVPMPPLPFQQQTQPEPPTVKAPDISIHDAAALGNNEAVKQHLTAGTDVNAKDESGWTPLHWAASKVHNKTAKLLIKEGADVNAVNKDGLSPLDYAENETFGFLIDHGAKSGAELKAEGK